MHNSVSAAAKEGVAAWEPCIEFVACFVCRKACRLDQDLKLEQKRAASLEKGKKQSEAAKAELEMRHQQQASDIAALREELTALQSVFKTIQRQQQVAAESISITCHHGHHQASPLSANFFSSLHADLLLRKTCSRLRVLACVYVNCHLCNIADRPPCHWSA